MNQKKITTVVGIGVMAVFALLTIALIAFSFIGQPTAVADNVVSPATTKRAAITNASLLLESLSNNKGANVAPAQPLQGTADQPIPEDFTNLYNLANPGVVNIEVIVQQAGALGEAVGSGFLYDNQGHIVTNNHVIAGAQRVIVTYSTGLQTWATVVGADPDSDLAVVKVENLPAEINPLSLGDLQTIQVGDWVAAIGSPFGLGSSMTVGVVSAVGRTIPAGAVPYGIPEAIQTDAAINPGNSGGPLLNLQGQVIGVNAQIATGGQTAANAGVGFAIPVNIVKRVVPVLIQTGTYQHPYLGIEGASVNLLLAQANRLPTQQGVYIDQVTPGGPAAQAGLQGSTGTTQISGLTVPVGGDVIVEAADQPVQNYGDLMSIIASDKPGDQITLTVLHNGRQQQVTITLGQRPSNTTVG